MVDWKLLFSLFHNEQIFNEIKRWEFLKFKKGMAFHTMWNPLLQENKAENLTRMKNELYMTIQHHLNYDK